MINQALKQICQSKMILLLAWLGELTMAIIVADAATLDCVIETFESDSNI